MRILEIEPKPFHTLCFLNAKRGGGALAELLELRRAIVDRLPAGVSALLASSDLQGMARGPHGASVLLGEALAVELLQLAAAGVVPAPGEIGVVLAGDFYSAPLANRRGASGDVRSVWTAFANSFRWVAGVMGNHDRFGTPAEEQQLRQTANVYLLDRDVVELDGLRIGGLGGIVGDPNKPGRITESAYQDGLISILAEKPEVCLFHQGPAGEKKWQRGVELTREMLRESTAELTICGHSHWDLPLAEISPRHQVLNVDKRAYLLTADG